MEKTEEKLTEYYITDEFHTVLKQKIYGLSEALAAGRKACKPFYIVESSSNKRVLSFGTELE